MRTLRLVGVLRRRVAVFFRLTGFFRVRALRRAGLTLDDTSALVAADCPANPANPPGGINGFLVGMVGPSFQVKVSKF